MFSQQLTSMPQGYIFVCAYVCMFLYTNVMPSRVYSMFRPDNGVVADLQDLHDLERQGLFFCFAAAPAWCVLIALAVYHQARQLTLSMKTFLPERLAPHIPI